MTKSTSEAIRMIKQGAVRIDEQKITDKKYQVLKNHKTNDLPEEAMAMIRYHSFYPWHTGMSYSSLLNEKDKSFFKNFS